MKYGSKYVPLVLVLCLVVTLSADNIKEEGGGAVGIPEILSILPFATHTHNSFYFCGSRSPRIVTMVSWVTLPCHGTRKLALSLDTSVA